MPAHHCFRPDDDYNVAPSRPQPAQGSPEEPIKAVYCRSGTFSLEYRNLLTQSKNFKRSIRASAQEDAYRGQKRQYEIQHEAMFYHEF